MSVPKTRLSTAMSGSASETEQAPCAISLWGTGGPLWPWCWQWALPSACAAPWWPAGPPLRRAEEPVFALTEPGEEQVPFADLLGLRAQ